MFRLPLALFALTLTVAACDSDPTASAEFDVLPLTIGQSWTMQEDYSVMFDQDGLPADTMVRDSDLRATMSVVRDSVIAGERWLRIEFTSERRFASNLIPGRGAWFTHRESSLYRLDDEGAAELLYSVDGASGRQVVTDPFKDIVLEGREIDVALPSGTVSAAVFTRTDKSTEFLALGGLAITPTVPTTDALSPTAGPVVLEALYVGRSRNGGEGLAPFLLKRYELVRGDA